MVPWKNESEFAGEGREEVAELSFKKVLGVLRVLCGRKV
jgi:hypothetical protein